MARIRLPSAKLVMAAVIILSYLVLQATSTSVCECLGTRCCECNCTDMQCNMVKEMILQDTNVTHCTSVDASCRSVTTCERDDAKGTNSTNEFPSITEEPPKNTTKDTPTEGTTKDIPTDNTTKDIPPPDHITDTTKDMPTDNSQPTKDMPPDQFTDTTNGENSQPTKDMPTDQFTDTTNGENSQPTKDMPTENTLTTGTTESALNSTPNKMDANVIIIVVIVCVTVLILILTISVIAALYWRFKYKLIRERSETEPTNTSYKASTASTGEQPQDDDPLYSVIDEYKITSHTMPPQVHDSNPVPQIQNYQPPYIPPQVPVTQYHGNPEPQEVESGHTGTTSFMQPIQHEDMKTTSVIQQPYEDPISALKEANASSEKKDAVKMVQYEDPIDALKDVDTSLQQQKYLPDEKLDEIHQYAVLTRGATSLEQGDTPS